jgi:hypothetical protein
MRIYLALLALLALELTFMWYFDYLSLFRFLMMSWVAS